MRDVSGPPSPASASAQPEAADGGAVRGGHGGGPPSGSSAGQPQPRPQSQGAPPSFERKPNGSGTDFSGWKCGERYKLLRALGHGSYGLVALATDLETNEKVAIKKIPNVFNQHIDARRILRETYILRHLDHLNLIKLRDIPQPENTETFTDLYLVFEYVLEAKESVCVCVCV
jgi:mitogen-activated protein kinase 1/3